MTTEKFCLRWNDFESNISVAFRELRDDKDFFDVTLACDDEQIQSHKMILSACSPFFRNILRRNPHQHPLIYLKGVKYTDLQSVLNFMYHGEVSVGQEELNSFLAVAEDLMVKGLTQNNPGNERLQQNDSYPTSRAASDSIKDKPDKPANKPLKRESTTKPIIKSNYFPHSNSNNDDEDLQEVAVVKTEPKDLPQPTSMHQSVGQDQYSSHVQQSSYAITAAEDNSVAYNDENYEEYEQFDEEQEYQGVENRNYEIQTNKGNHENSFKERFKSKVVKIRKFSRHIGRPLIEKICL